MRYRYDTSKKGLEEALGIQLTEKQFNALGLINIMGNDFEAEKRLGIAPIVFTILLVLKALGMLRPQETEAIDFQKIFDSMKEA